MVIFLLYSKCGLKQTQRKLTKQTRMLRHYISHLIQPMKMCYKAESNSYLVLGQLLPETCNPPSKEYIYSVTKTTEHVVLYFNI